MKDTLYSKDLGNVKRFQFNENVVNVFNDMIQRSVPGYDLILSLLAVVSEQFSQDDCNYYDLGCSLGASTLAMRHAIKANNCKIIAIDNSTAMIEQCKKNIANDKANIPVDIQCADILNTPMENSCISVLNFTLQFIPQEQRQSLLNKIGAATVPGGALVLSEKIVFENDNTSQRMIDLHHKFKALNGYSDLEIAQKRDALENVLIPEQLTTHHERLLAAGFSEVLTCVQCFNFVSLLAIK